MKKEVGKLFFVIVLALGVLGGVVPSIAQAQDVNIAVLDTREVFRESKAGAQIKDQVEAKRNEYLEQIKAKETALRATEKKLLDEKSSLSQEEFLKRRQDFEAKLLEADKFAKQKNLKLEEAYSKAMNELHGEVLKLTEGLAEERGYTIVLRRKDVFIASKTINITQEILAALNKKNPKITLDIKD